MNRFLLFRFIRVDLANQKSGHRLCLWFYRIFSRPFPRLLSSWCKRQSQLKTAIPVENNSSFLCEFLKTSFLRYRQSRRSLGYVTDDSLIKAVFLWSLSLTLQFFARKKYSKNGSRIPFRRRSVAVTHVSSEPDFRNSKEFFLKTYWSTLRIILVCARGARVEATDRHVANLGNLYWVTSTVNN